METMMIHAHNLRKVYGETTVLSIPDFRIMKGESFGLVGNNGAGKTTFFSLMLDLVIPTDGSLLSGTIPVHGSEQWKQYTGSYLDERFLIDFLTPEEYFAFIGEVYSLPTHQVEDHLKEFSGFFGDEILGNGKYIRELSKGNQKKIGLAGAMLSRPDVLILDEPFPHLDPSTVGRLKKLLQSYHERFNTTILISSHDLHHVTEICDRIALLEKGRILWDEVRSQETLRKLQTYFSVDG
jgi:ABC-2 type transport system ATP-binding protein